jgi:hypothetical protein
MADDITLTVRVRDLARGDFAQLQRRLQGMDRDVRRLGNSTAQTSERSQRLSQNIRSISQRMTQLHQTGSLANSDMDHMRRTMGLLSRELRLAARAGDITEDQFRSLRDELDETRLSFDHLSRDVRRHSAVAQRAAREAAAAQREEMRRQMAEARLIDAQRRRLMRAETAAYREEARRQSALQRRQEAELRQHIRRLSALSDDDQGITLRFRGLNDNDIRRMTHALGGISGAVNSIGGSSGRARRNVAGLSDDLRAMAQILRDAQSGGNLARRDLNALANGLNTVTRSAQALRRSGDISRSTLRSMRSEADLLRAQLRLLGRDGNIFSRSNDQLRIFQHRLRAVRNDGNLLQRSLNRMGDTGAGGLRTVLTGVNALLTPMRRLGSAINLNQRWTAILIASLVLIGPIAQALGALLVTALGGAFVALGAFALRGEKDVRSAFNRMKGNVGSTVRAAAQPLKSVLVQAMNEVGEAVRGMEGQLNQAFAATAPLVSNLVGAFTDLAARALPGITASLRAAGPVMEGFRDAMGLIGEGIGQMFDSMTQGGGAEGLGKVWQNLGQEIRDLLVDIGEFINAMSQSATATALMSAIFETLSGVLIIIEAGFKAIDTVLGPLIEKMDELGLTSGVIGVLSSALEAMGISSSEATVITGRLGDANSDAAGDAERHATAISDLVKQLQNLADLNRNYLDAQAAQAEALTKATEDSGKYSNALKMNKGQLDLTSTAAQQAYRNLSDFANATKESTAKAMEAHAPWEQIRANWQKGYTDLVNLADGMGLNKDQAKQLADLILGMPPSKEVWVQARVKQAQQDLDGVIAALEAAPNEKQISVKTLTADSIAALQQLGFTVAQLPDGSFTVTANTGTARTNVGKVQAARDALKGKSITMSAEDASTGVINAIKNLVSTLTGKTITITTVHKNILQNIVQGPAQSAADAIQQQADRLRGGSSGGMAGSLPRKKFASGGSVSGSVLEGPGTSTSDSLIARLSRGEFVMRAAAVRRYGANFMRMVNHGTLRLPGFASGGSADARKTLAGSMSISAFGRLGGATVNNFEKGLAKPDSMSALVASINSTLDLIKKAFSGNTEKNLVAKMNAAGKSLITYEKKLIAVNSKLDKAKDSLTNLQQSANSLRDSVKSGIINEASVTRAASGDKNVTILDVMASMRQNRDKATAFSSALARLKENGVSGEIIRQIAEAGISGGGLETAGALLGASASEIASLNQMQAQIGSAAKSAGATAADAMYGAGIKAAQGLVNGLLSQKAGIEKSMMAIAKSMEKAIKAALGIKSPSRVMQEVGHYTAEGFAVGLEKNRSVDTAWTSMINVAPSVTPSGTSGGGGTYVIPIYIGNRMLDEIILDSNRRTVRTRGGNVQAVFGNR